MHLENDQKIDYHHVIFPYFTTKDHCSLWKKSSMIFPNSAGTLRTGMPLFLLFPDFRNFHQSSVKMKLDFLSFK